MKNLWFFFIGFGIMISGCGDDTENNTNDAPYAVDIIISNPTANASINANESQNISVSFTSEGIIHNIKIEFQNMDTQITEVLFDEHVHQQQTFAYQNVKTFETAGRYKMIVTTTNMEETESLKEEIEFEVL